MLINDSYIHTVLSQSAYSVDTVKNTEVPDTDSPAISSVNKSPWTSRNVPNYGPVRDLPADEYPPLNAFFSEQISGSVGQHVEDNISRTERDQSSMGVQ